jgi:hypothetical protein
MPPSFFLESDAAHLGQKLWQFDELVLNLSFLKAGYRKAPGFICKSGVPRAADLPADLPLLSHSVAVMLHDDGAAAGKHSISGMPVGGEFWITRHWTGSEDEKQAATVRPQGAGN